MRGSAELRVMGIGVHFFRQDFDVGRCVICTANECQKVRLSQKCGRECEVLT